MHRRYLSQKGLALILISGLSLLLFAGVMAVLFVLGANTRNLEAFKERAVAYYLCETGASVAIRDIARGMIGGGSDPWWDRTFNYDAGNTTYSISYRVTKSGQGAYEINSQVGPSSGFRRTYSLRVTGRRRAFPIFIRGLPGK